ncbi:hypothetical protein M422DRAFT_67156 [Sphaerobolus stellatus SS14]|uniref:Uncharacterized protein n=1 Tax=Sphaerobolus stellatus (strain SS14) TaxID=990650 RepID=A0A0C9W3F6_SPHS4|nr:hypothetical protein M422DRAFT_67156 [Sphaerobolus stellatus SS14]
MSDLNQNQLRGFKAAAHNPNVSESAQDHAREVLNDAGVSEEPGSLHAWDQEHHSQSKYENSSAHQNNVLRGHKATLSNPNTSEEAKEHSAEVLREHDRFVTALVRANGTSSNSATFKSCMANPTEGASDNASIHAPGSVEDLTQATIALHSAYDRLLELRNTLAEFSARTRGRSMAHPQQHPQLGAPQNPMQSHAQASAASSEMHPDHSAIVLAEEENDVQAAVALPTRLRELSTRLREELRQVSAARTPGQNQDQNDETEQQNASSANQVMEHHRRTLRSFRDAYRHTSDVVRASGYTFSEDVADGHPMPMRNLLAMTTEETAAATRERQETVSRMREIQLARRRAMEGSIRSMRRSAEPNEATTTLGRRVMHRAAAAASVNASGAGDRDRDTVVHSTLPLGLESRPVGSERPVEPRAATHLRHSLLPNPRVAMSRADPRAGHASRYGEARQRFAMHASNNAGTARGTDPAGASATAATQTPSGAQVTTTTPSESVYGSYRIRRRINSQGEEQVTTINFRDLLAEYQRGDWDMETVGSTRREPSSENNRAATSTTTTNNTRPGNDLQTSGRPPQRRRRGWARLDMDGDEISTEDEELYERRRVQSLQNRFNETGRTNSSAAVLDLVQRNGVPGCPDVPSSAAASVREGNDDQTKRILDSIFKRRKDDDTDSEPFVSPLPVPHPPKKFASPKRPREVLLCSEVQAGR